MLLLLALPIGLLAGFSTGGRLSGLGKLPLLWPWMLLPALLIQLLIFPVFTDRAIVQAATAPLHILSYVLISIWILKNIRILPIDLLGIGAIGNFVVLLANGGLMPASVAALQAAGLGFPAERLLQEGVYSNLILMSERTRLNFLGDLLYVPQWIPLSSAFSIGDLLILLALIWLIVKGMRLDGKRTRETS